MRPDSPRNVEAAGRWIAARWLRQWHGEQPVMETGLPIDLPRRCFRFLSPSPRPSHHCRAKSRALSIHQTQLLTIALWLAPAPFLHRADCDDLVGQQLLLFPEISMPDNG